MLRAALVLIGFTAVAAQVVLLRELMVVFYGNEIGLGLALAAWLLWTGLGSGVLGRLAARFPPRAGMAVLQTLAAVALPVAVLTVRASRGWFASTPGEVLGPGPMLLATLVALGPFCAISGCLFAAGSRLYASRSGAEAAEAGGVVYLLEGIGAGVGGALAGALLVPLAGSFGTVVAVGWLNLLAAAGVLRARRRAAAALVVLALALPAAARWLETVSLARLWSGYHLLANENTIYGNLALTANGEAGGTLFENGLVLGNVPDPAAAEEAVHYALLQHAAPRSLLLAGGGVNGSLAQALRHPTLRRADYVELDPAIPALAARFFPAWASTARDPRIRIHHADARFYLKTAPESWDVIILNLPDPQTAQLNRFYTEEFFREAARKLNPGGLLSFHLAASENYIGPARAAFLRSIHKTLRGVFPEVAVLPGDPVHFFAALQPGTLTASPEPLLARLRQRALGTMYVREYYLPFRMMPDRVAELAAAIRPLPDTPVNRDFAPIAYYFGVSLWSARFHGAWPRVFEVLAGVGFAPLAAAIVAVLLAAAFFLRRRPAAAGFAVAAMGFMSLGTEMLLLLAFQAIYGYVYHQLALVIAGFMAGSALGSWRGLRSRSRALAGLQFAAAAAPLALYGVFELLARAGGALAPALFPLLALLCGGLAGWQFPVAGRVFFGMHDGRPGTLYALDLVGACCAALVFSTWLVPVYGFFRTALLTAAVSLAPAFAVLRPGPRAPVPKP